MSSRRLVVRTHSPRRTWLARGALVLCVALLALSAHELGQYRANIDYRAALDARTELAREVAELRQRNQALRERVAVLETSRNVEDESYRELESGLESLQARLQAKQEELQFYQGIVSPEDRVPGLRIERFRVEPRGANRHRLRMVLTQALRQQRRVEGRVSLHVEGMVDGERQRLDIAALRRDEPDENGSVEISFSFRYFQDIELDFELPEDFGPMAVAVELLPEGSDRKSVTRSFDWPGIDTSGDTS